MTESDVARWHRLSGLPDNVTDDGEVVPSDPERRARAEKALLRAAITRVHEEHASGEAHNFARLAASYLLAGDVETAWRYVERAAAVGDSDAAGSL